MPECACISEITAHAAGPRDSNIPHPGYASGVQSPDTSRAASRPGVRLLYPIPQAGSACPTGTRRAPRIIPVPNLTHPKSKRARLGTLISNPGRAPRSKSRSKSRSRSTSKDNVKGRNQDQDQLQSQTLSGTDRGHVRVTPLSVVAVGNNVRVTPHVASQGSHAQARTPPARRQQVTEERTGTAG
jgi:hypothetical protein